MIQTGSPAAVDKHMDQLETVSNVFMVAVLIVFLTSAGAEKELTLLGAKLDTDSAYGVVVVFYDAVFLVIAAYLWRVTNLLLLSDPIEVEKCFASAFAHKWLLNPFSFVGSRASSRIVSSLGMCFFVLSWWVGLSSLALLAAVSKASIIHRNVWSPIPFLSDSLDVVFTYAFMLLGLAAIFSIFRFYQLISRRFAELQVADSGGTSIALSKEGRIAIRSRAIAIALTTIVGFFTYWLFAHVGA